MERDPVAFFDNSPEKSSEAREFYARKQRRALNIPAAYVCLIVPWLVFIVIYCLTSFHAYYTNPDLCVLFVVLVGLAILSFGIHAVWKRLGRSMGSEETEPNWYIFLFLTCVAAWACGLVLGLLNFRTNMHPYYSYRDFEAYADVSPARTRSQQFMDAASVAFSNDTTLDLAKSMGFRNIDTYCVAPITMQGAQLDSYDFWAVGLDCCTSSRNDFRCGNAYRQPGQQGLRLLKDDDRPFYRLAIEQARAAYQIKVTHPLMFYWVQDAEAEIFYFRDMGYRYFMIGMIAHFGWQILAVVCAAAAFNKGKAATL